MIQVAGVIPDLIHIGSDQRGQPVIFLQVHGKNRLGSLPEDFQSLDVLLAIDCDADDIGPGLFKNLDLPGGGVDIHGPGSSHALNGYRRIASNRQGTDMDFPGFTGLTGLTGLDFGIHNVGSFLEGLV